MSYDIHLLRFKAGEPSARPAGTVHELLSCAAETDPDEHGRARVRWHGGEADCYGVTRSPDEPLESLMFSRPAGDAAIFDLIYRVAVAGAMTILLQDGEVCLVDPNYAVDLPADAAAWPRHVVSSGEQLARVVTGK